MKVVVNRYADGWGSFGISRQALKDLGLEGRGDNIERIDPALIALIEEKGADYVNGAIAELEVVEIPDEATDWRIDDYEGAESIIAVVNGKLKDY